MNATVTMKPRAVRNLRERVVRALWFELLGLALVAAFDRLRPVHAEPGSHR